MTDPLIYLDNASTSFPKPGSMLEKMMETYSSLGVSPGRGSYDLAVEAQWLVEEARKKLAQFFGAPDPNHIIFASNATDALNLVIQGLLDQGDHVVSTRLEHTSVLRPLFHLSSCGLIEYDLAPFDEHGFVDPKDVAGAIRPNTRLVIVNHASNVLGTVQPIPEIGRLCAQRSVPLVIDAAQSAGQIPIDMDAWQVAGVAFTGHKSLMGPTGTGGLALHPELDIKSTRFGGTGIDSRDLIHTQTFPHRLEAGTLNLLGIIGLSAGLDFLTSEGLEKLHRQEMGLLTRLRDGLSGLDGLKLHCAEDLSNHVGLLTVNLEGMEPEDLGAILDGDFDVLVRVGLHCAPLAHETLGTFPEGGVRFSLGPFNTEEEIDHTIAAMASIASSK